MALLLVDLDDTVLPRRDAFRAWASDYLDELGQPEELDWLVQADQNGLRSRDEFFGSMIEHLRLDHTRETLAEFYYDRFLSTFTCPAEVAESLRRVRAHGFRIAIVTNGEHRAQTAKISSAALADLVDVICISGTEGVAKPAAEFFELAASRCGEPLEGAWMIGDNPETDIGGAHRLGLRTVWMHLGRAWPHTLSYRPHYEADTFSDAVDVMLSHARP
jgi:putative hydrolase of the HAD superfamily